MNTILVWVLVTIGGVDATELRFSPQVADLDSCVRMQKATKEISEKINARPPSSKCVQISVVK